MVDNDAFGEQRVRNLEELMESGQRPYGVIEESPSDVSEFIEEHRDYDNIEDNQIWVLSGRIMRENEFGEFVFYDIDDRTGTVQVMCSIDSRSEFETEEYRDLDNINIGDRVVFTGHPGYSDTGELTLHAHSYNVASKALTDVSRDRNQLSNRQQITDRTGALSTNDELYTSVKERLEIQQHVREYLTKMDYLEVETPILHNYAGGAEATPFETYCESLDEDLFLRIAPELYLKRMIVSGYKQVFEFARCFRNEDIDTTHNPEFTMLELYKQYADYHDMMELTENLFSYAAAKANNSDNPVVNYDGKKIDFSPNWKRVTFDSLIEDTFDESVEELTPEKLRYYLQKEHDIDASDIDVFDRLLMEVFEAEIEPELVGPIFVHDYPAVSTPLCRTLPDDDTRVQRFEAFVDGVEIANSYTELTDPREQRERLIEQANGNEDAINNEFVEALCYAMPPTAGLGIGIERMAMLLTDSQSIKSVLPYPMTSSRR